MRSGAGGRNSRRATSDAGNVSIAIEGPTRVSEYTTKAGGANSRPMVSCRSLSKARKGASALELEEGGLYESSLVVVAGVLFGPGGRRRNGAPVLRDGT